MTKMSDLDDHVSGHGRLPQNVRHAWKAEVTP
jgi:hypothetical protein